MLNGRAACAVLVNMISAPFIAAADYQPPVATVGPPPGQPHVRTPYPPSAAAPGHSPPHWVPPINTSHRQHSGGFHSAASPPGAAHPTHQHSPPHPAAAPSGALPAGAHGYARDHRQSQHTRVAAPQARVPQGVADVAPAHLPRAAAEPPARMPGADRGSGAPPRQHGAAAVPPWGTGAPPPPASIAGRSHDRYAAAAAPSSTELGVQGATRDDMHAAIAWPQRGVMEGDAAVLPEDASDPPSPFAPVVDVPTTANVHTASAGAAAEEVVMAEGDPA